MGSSNRRGEVSKGGVPDRSDRVFQQGEFWYFHTREDVQIGPFDNQVLALRGANDYVGFAIEADPAVLGSLSQ